jgi:hypothetical protein
VWHAGGPYWVRVWHPLRSVCCVVPVGRWGLAGAARGSTERSHLPCSRVCVGEPQVHAQATRVQGEPDGAPVIGVRMRHVDVIVLGRGHVRPVSPRPAGATGAGVRQFRSACARGALGLSSGGLCAPTRLDSETYTNSSIRTPLRLTALKDKTRSAAVPVSNLIVLLSQQAPDLSVPPVRADW